MKLGKVIASVAVMLIFCSTVWGEVYKNFQNSWIEAQSEEAEITRRGPLSFDVSGRHDIAATVRATVDPWINSDITATEMQWFIRAPQTYLAKFFRLTVHTNSTEGFHLTIDDSTGLESDSGASLDTWYAFVIEREGEEDKSSVIPSESLFLRGGDEFNNFRYETDQGPVIVNFYLWNKVQVDTLSPAEEYRDEFTVTISCGM